MKLLLRFIILCLIGLLAACASNAAVQVTPTAPPAQTIAPVDEAQGAAPVEQVSEVRPQFLNSYADW